MKQAVVACLLYVTASQVTEAFGGRGKFGGGKFRSLIKNKLKHRAEKISEFCGTGDFDLELCNCAEIMKTDRLEWTDEQKVTMSSCKDKLKEKLKSKFQGNDESPAFELSKFKEARREQMSEMCETVDETDMDMVARCRCLAVRGIEPENRSVEEAVVAVVDDCLERMEKFRNFKDKMEGKMEGLDGEQKILAKKCMKARMAIRIGLASEKVNKFFGESCGEFQRMNRAF